MPNPLAGTELGQVVNDNGNVKTTLAEALSSALDSIDVNKMTKGAVTTVHSGIVATTTSTEVSCVGFNSIIVFFDITAGAGTWTIALTGAMVSGGTFVAWNQLQNGAAADALVPMSLAGITADQGWIWRGVPDYIKIVATETADGATVTVKVQPLNL